MRFHSKTLILHKGKCKINKRI